MVRTITEFKIDVNRRGAYDADTMYYPHDLVTSGGQMYLSVVASKGAALNNSQYWMAIAKGTPGDPGRDGLNAYQLAIQEQGFTGSISDWLRSLKGEKGDPGAPGKVDGLVNNVDYDKYTDVNELTSSGSVFYLSKSMTNLPTDKITTGFLVVFASSDGKTVTQIFINPLTNDVYVRSLADGNWSDWRWITQW